MSEFEEGYEKWLCKPCSRSFASWEGLHDHKIQMRQMGENEHFYCQLCSVDFKTEKAESLHILQMHQKQQSLRCPGCFAGPFTKMWFLLSHIEIEKCRYISIEDIKKMRETKLRTTQQLDVTNWEVKRDSFREALEKPDIPAWPETTHQWQAPKPRHEAIRRTSFITPPPRTSEVVAKPSNPNGFSMKSAFGVWGAQKLESSAGKTRSHVSTKSISETQSENPFHPSFNFERCYCKLSDRYICPQAGCSKTFKAVQGLIGHLKSRAHKRIMYSCPYCQALFRSLTDVVRHVEVTTTSCRIRETAKYPTFLEQLTGGLLHAYKIQGRKGQYEYIVPDSIQEAFKSQAEASGTTGTNVETVVW